MVGLRAGNVEKQDLGKATVIIDSFNDIELATQAFKLAAKTCTIMNT